MNVKLIATTKPADMSLAELIEYAGRICTNTTDRLGDDTQEFLDKRYEQGHLSIFEHVNFTFEIDGISRACSHQLVRHRLASYSQESMRYSVQNEEYVTPDSILINEEALKDYLKFMIDAWKLYDRLIANGIKPEDARFVLPIASTTRILVTMNLRQWWHFINMRNTKTAQWEIREVARQIKNAIDGLLNKENV